jgi:hypothetical protein
MSVKNLFLLLLGVAIGGCSGNFAQKTNEKAPAKQAQTKQAPVDSTAIAVIPNPYDDDQALADQAAGEAKQELLKRGYTVVASEAEAKLIAVPTVETNVVTVAKASSDRPTGMFSDAQLAQLDRPNGVANSLGSLGQVSFEGAGVSVGKGKDVLVIEVFAKDTWDHALIVNELQLQPAWKIRMPLPADLKPSVGGEKIAHAAGTDFQLPH